MNKITSMLQWNLPPGHWNKFKGALILAVAMLISTGASATVYLTIHNTGCEDMKVYKKDWGWESYQTTIPAGDTWSCWTWFNQDFVFRKLSESFLENYTCGYNSNQSHSCNTGGCGGGGGACGEQLSYWSLNACSAGSSYSEFTASTNTPSGFSSVSASVVSNTGDHSCSPSPYGKSMCHGIRDNCSWNNNDANAFKFSITVKPSSGKTAKVGKISFYEAAPSSYNWTSGQSGDNDPPSKYGIRVTVNGNEVFKQIDIATTSSWSLEEFDFSNDPDFSVTSQTTFNFELLGYCRQGSNGYAVWDIDEVKIFGCSESPCASQGGDSDNDGVCNNQDCAPNNASLPATPGTSCNDGNANTTNDVIQADGCTCAGTPVVQCNLNLNVTQKVCDGKGTTSTADDTYTFAITVTGTNTSSTWSGSFNNAYLGTFAIGPTAYGTAITLGPFPAGQFTSSNTNPPIVLQNGLDINVSVNDSQNTGCSKSTTVTSTGPCSPPPTICDNVISGGTIGFGSNCLSSASIACNTAAPSVTNCANPTGGSGALEIVWLKSTTSCSTPTSTAAEIAAGLDPHWSMIPGQTGLSLSPGVVSANTCYLRCARRAGCDVFIESNIISLTTDCGGGGSTPNCADITITTGSGTITVAGLAGAPISSLQVFSSTWQTMENCFGNCGATKTVNVPAGSYYVYVKYYTSGYALICEKNTTVTVTGGGGCADADNDGTCDANDCQPNNPAYPATPGTACNDGNANTNNDVVQADGCSCAGTPTGGGSDCANISITTGTGTITVTGLGGAPISSLQIFSASWQTIENCFGNCGASKTVNVQAGTYYVYAKYYTASYSLICEKNTTVTVTGGGCADADNDGTCDANDCQPNNPAYPATPGTPCNDGNPNTTNDVVTANGCGCAGTVSNPCANQGGDSDGDGVCNNQDCQPNNPAYPATPGTACNDGNTNTNNDVVTADGCGCAGTPVNNGCVSGTQRSVTNTNDNCGSWCGSSYVLTFGSGQCYTAGSDLVFKEFNDGTATLTGTVKKGSSTLNVNVTFSGKKTSAPSGSPHYDLCINSGGSSWYYYTNFSGTVGSYNITRYGPSFQIGNGANLQESQYGASGWFSYGGSTNGDFNFRLGASSNVGGDADNDGVCDNVDCQPNNASYPATPGTACNDGNSNTTNDVVQADGCSCAGTTTGGGSYCKVGKRVFHDKNKNGIFDGNDTGMSGIWVNLKDHLGNSKGWTVTDNSGHFQFDNLNPGNYKVGFSTPGGYVPTSKHSGSDDHNDSDIDYWTGHTDIFSLIAGQFLDHCDAGYISGQYLLGNEQGFDFDVVKNEEHTSLHWAHKEGYKVENYVVERSADGENFEPIAVNQSEGTHSFEYYENYDLEPMKGDNYYRIAVVNLDGSIAYSAVKMVNYADLVDFILFPNPANEFVKINFEEVLGQAADISIYNNMGVLMQQFQVDEVYGKYYQMDIRNLHEGHYIVWVTVPGRRPVAKSLMVGKL